MDLYAFIDFVIWLTIIIVIIWVIFWIILILFYLGHITGLYITNKGKQMHDLIFRTLIALIAICMPPLTIYIYFVLYLLCWIFFFWLIILYIVPPLIFVFIPFIPFIIPIPLRFLILQFVPPFKQLTDKGVLPLMRRIIFRFFEFFPQGKIKEWVKISAKDVYSFLFKEISSIFYFIFKLININAILPEPDNKEISKGIQDDEYPVEDDELNKKNEEEEIFRKKDNENEETKKIQNLINEELNICLKSKQSFITSDKSQYETSFSGVNDMNNYSECYAQSIKSYFDNLL
jgi:hypothetical protein